MQKTEHILGTTTLRAAVALMASRFVSFAGTHAADAPCAGVANDTYAAGDDAGVKTHGRLLVETGGAIAQGAHVKSDATGRAVTADAATSEGRAYEAATAAGQFITIQR